MIFQTVKCILFLENLIMFKMVNISPGEEVLDKSYDNLGVDLAGSDDKHVVDMWKMMEERSLIQCLVVTLKEYLVKASKVEAI